MSTVSNELVVRVLRAYADVSAPAPTSSNLTVAPFSELEVFPPRGGTGTAGLLGPYPGMEGVPSDALPMAERLAVRSTPTTERLAKLDALHADEQLIRHSWVLVVGTIDVDGTARQVLQPLLSRPARLNRRSLLRRVVGAADDLDNALAFGLTYLGDARMTDRIDDPDVRAKLLTGAAFGRGSLRPSTNETLVNRMPELTGWIRAAATAAGLPVSKIVAPSEDPEEWIRRPGLVAIPTHSLHTSRQVSVTSLRTTLLAWSRRRGIDRSALAQILAPEPDAALETADPAGTVEVESPMLLSASQRAVVQRSRSRPVTVVSGAPGTGKTHALCAVAEDAVARGESVLIATQTRHAADVVGELLDRTPGPTPVRFGDGTGMAGLIDELTERRTHPVDPDEIRRRDLDLDLARAEVETLRSSIASRLQLEADAQDAPRWQPALPALMAAAPGVFAPSSNLDELERLLAAATPDPGDGWWAQRRRRRARRRLEQATGAERGVELSRVDNAVRAARAGRAVATLASRAGTEREPEHDWDALAAAEARWREALGRRRRLAPFEPQALGAGSRAAIGELLTALRAGRGRRRELLAAMRPGELTTAAPLWVGTLADIEDVLPAAPALFDLVILDESSQIDQPRAAPALLRARRAVVVGDPHQLRHVSFRSDEEVDRTLRTHGLQDRRGQLDVRRSSAFDLAATAAPIDHLREHFRSVPHLIEFSVRSFYRDRVEVMTRHPRNEVLDAIDVITVEAGTERGVQTAEIRRVVEVVRELCDSGTTGIGTITPFRDQADALELAILEEFSSSELSQLDLRVGTVHSFQGGERDTVVLSLGLGVDDPPGRRRFAEQRDLFNVMVTRARRRVIVVTSLPGDGTGLIDQYLRYAAHPLPPPEPTSGATRSAGVQDWRDALGSELGRYHTVRTDYPVGPWALDLCVGDGDDARGLDCGVDPDGVTAHIDRRLTLMGLGWRCQDAFASRWDDNAARAALELR